MTTSFAIDPTFQDRIWKRLFRYVQRHGWQRAESEDLTQEIFAYLLEGDRLERLQEKAENEQHFYHLIRKCARRRLSNHRRHQQAAKRRAWSERVSLDRLTAEIVAGEALPDQYHQPGLSYSQLETLVAEGERLTEEAFRRRGKVEVFAELKEYLSRPGNPNYEQISRRLQTTESSLRTSLCRARSRFRHFIESHLSTAA